MANGCVAKAPKEGEVRVFHEFGVFLEKAPQLRLYELVTAFLYNTTSVVETTVTVSNGHLCQTQVISGRPQDRLLKDLLYHQRAALVQIIRDQVDSCQSRLFGGLELGIERGSSEPALSLNQTEFGFVPVTGKVYWRGWDPHYGEIPKEHYRFRARTDGAVIITDLYQVFETLPSAHATPIVDPQSYHLRSKVRSLPTAALTA